MTICFVCKTDQVVKYNLVLLYSYFYHLPQSKLGYFYFDNISKNIKITIINNEEIVYRLSRHTKYICAIYSNEQLCEESNTRQATSHLISSIVK